MTERDQLMTPEQLVEYLNLPSVQVIYKWNATGTGPPLQSGTPLSLPSPRGR
jgi:hypothetical protein